MEIPTSIRSERLTSSVYIRFCADYARLVTTPASRKEVAGWRACVPELHDLADLAELPSVLDEPDRVLAGLVRLYQDGSELAGAALLHQMMPKLLRLTPYARIRQHDHAGGYEERAADTIAAFLTVAATYGGTGRGIAGALALKTLGVITSAAGVDTEIALDPVELVDRAEPVRGSADINVDEVLDWAVERGVITGDERDLLDRAYLTDGGADLRELADEIGISHAALRRRLHRAVSRLSNAVGTTAPTRRRTIQRRAA